MKENFDTLADAIAEGYTTIADTKTLLPKKYKVVDTSGDGYFGYDYAIQDSSGVIVINSYNISTGMNKGWQNIRITPMFRLTEILEKVV